MNNVRAHQYYVSNKNNKNRGTNPGFGGSEAIRHGFDPGRVTAGDCETSPATLSTDYVYRHTRHIRILTYNISVISSSFRINVLL